MTTITDKRGWLSKLRGLVWRGPASTEERMERVRQDLEELLARDPEQRLRHAQGAASPEGRAALSRGLPEKERTRLAKLLGPSTSSGQATSTGGGDG